MGQPQSPPKVKFFLSALSTDRNLLDSVRKPLEKRLGEIESVTKMCSWNFSPAYSRELGTGILRRFFVFTDLQDPEDLPHWKLCAIELERVLADAPNVERKINLDPGYVSGSQVIIASTKRYANRVYLRHGIYADLTLYYDGSTFRPLGKLTFPDYRTKSAIKFFEQTRSTCLRQLRSTNVKVNDVPISGRERMHEVQLRTELGHAESLVNRSRSCSELAKGVGGEGVARE